MVNIWINSIEKFIFFAGRAIWQCITMISNLQSTLNVTFWDGGWVERKHEKIQPFVRCERFLVDFEQIGTIRFAMNRTPTVHLNVASFRSKTTVFQTKFRLKLNFNASKATNRDFSETFKQILDKCNFEDFKHISHNNAPSNYIHLGHAVQRWLTKYATCQAWDWCRQSIWGYELHRTYYVEYEDRG